MVPQRGKAARSAESKAAPRDGRQEGRSVSFIERQSEGKASAVPARATQGAKTHTEKWRWVEASVWNERRISRMMSHWLFKGDFLTTDNPWSS